MDAHTAVRHALRRTVERAQADAQRLADANANARRADPERDSRTAPSGDFQGAGTERDSRAAALQQSDPIPELARRYADEYGYGDAYRDGIYYGAWIALNAVRGCDVDALEAVCVCFGSTVAHCAVHD